MTLLFEQVLALAPAAGSAAAGKKLGTPGPWQNLGGNDDVYWGECKGSALYQVRGGARRSHRQVQLPEPQRAKQNGI